MAFAITPNPGEAPYLSMPESAIQNVEVDYVLPVREIGARIVDLIRVPAQERGNVMCNHTDETLNGHTDPAEGVTASTTNTDDWGTPSAYACPDCHGTLWEVETPSGILRFRCRIGHAYSAASLAAQQGDRVEEALWTALRALQERSALAERLAARARSQSKTNSAQRFQEQKQELDAQASLLREIVQRGQIDADTSEKSTHTT